MSAGALDVFGRAAAIEAWRALLRDLPAASPRQLWLVDADFDAWPLDEPEVMRALTEWVRQPGRRMTWLGAGFAALEKAQPRLATWRRTYAHAVEAFVSSGGEVVDWPCWLLAERRAVEIDDRPHWRGRVVTEPMRLRAMRESIDALLQRCEPGWPGTTLGL